MRDLILESDWIMGIKGGINIIAVMSSIIMALGSFGTWTVFKAYETIEVELTGMKDARSTMSERMQKIELQNEARFRSLTDAIDGLSRKFDGITEIKVRK